MKVLEAEARAGFPRMHGARLRATVPIDQVLVDGWLSRTGVGVEIEDGNRLSISYGSVRTGAEIAGITPDLTIVLKVPWWSRAAVWGVLVYKPGLQAYLRQQGGFVHIVCSQIPAVAKYRYLWRHVAEVQVRTVPGRLVLGIRVFVE